MKQQIRRPMRFVLAGTLTSLCLAGTLPRAAAASAPPAPAWNDRSLSMDAAEQAPLPPDLANAQLPTLHAVAAAPPTAATTNSVTSFGDATDVLGGGAVPVVQPLTAVARTPDGKGLWVLAGDGGVFAYGTAPFMGSIAEMHLGVPATAIVATPDGGGYWIVVSDGRVFSFGNAKFAGAIAGAIGAPIVSMAATPDGGGYWLMSNDGRIFTFGNAAFAGAIAGGIGVPLVAMATSPDGGGYWLVSNDGRIFTFGNAKFAGAVVGAISAPVVGMARTKDGGGYWLVTGDGSILTFGNAATRGSLPGAAVGIMSSPSDGGYWIAYGRPVPTGPLPFNADVVNFLAGRRDSATAAVFDVTTGRTYVYHPGQLNHTASIVKVDIMATLFSAVAGARRSLTSTELNLLAPMIESSNNAAASALWGEVGGAGGVARFNTLVPMPETTPGPGGLWGFTNTTALDQISLLKRFAFPNSVLTDADRGRGLSLMQSVIPSQRWGIPAGVPAGVTVANKNGWAPIGGRGWAINSIGVVSGLGRYYLIAVLTQDNPGMAYGIDTIQGVATRVWQNPAGG